MILKFLLLESYQEVNERLVIGDGIPWVHHENLAVPLNWLLHAPHYIDHA
jgi:hypothetical protein